MIRRSEMGLRDRKYMQEQPEESEGSAGLFFMRLFTVLLAAYLTFFCVRVPLPLFLKPPLLVGLFFLLRYLWRLPERMQRDSFLAYGQVAAKDGNFIKAAYHFERALELDPNNVRTAIRLLAAYESSNQVTKSRQLILALEGAVIPAALVEQFEHLASDYRLVTLEDAPGGRRVRIRKN